MYLNIKERTMIRKTSLYTVLILLVTILSACAQKTKNDKKMKVEHLTKETFKQKVFNFETNKDWKFEGTKPCIVDFYASWCGPCKMIAPILEELKEEYKGKVDIYKVDTEKERDLAGMFGIRSIPALLFVPKNGQPQMVNGALGKKDFIKVIEDVLKVKKAEAIK